MSPPTNNPDPAAVEVLHRYVLETVGPEPANWRGGWPDELEAALIDAVFSVRARYGSRERQTGVCGAWTRWRDHLGERANDLRVLAATSPDALRSITNNGKVSRRYKADVAIDAAAALHKAGIVTAQDFRDNQEPAKAAYLSIKGCGPVTLAYLGMLIEFDAIKPDIWIKRFVQDRIHNATQDEATSLLTAVAERLNIEARRLDHAVWAYRRSAKAPHES